MKSRVFFGLVALSTVLLAAALLVIGLAAGKTVDRVQYEVAFAWFVNVALVWCPLVVDPLVTHRPVDWFSPRFFSIIIGVFTIARPVLLVFGVVDPLWLEGAQDAWAGPLLLTMWLSALAQVSLLIGYYLPIGAGLARRTSTLREHWNLRRLRAVIGAVLVCAGTAYMVIMTSAGGVLAFINQIGQRRALLEGQQYLLVLTLVLPVCLAIAVAAYLRLGRKPPLSVVVLVFGCVVMLATLGGRGATASLVVICAGLYHYQQRRLRFLEIAVLATSGILLLSLYQDLRVSTFGGELDVAGTLDRRDWLDSIVAMDEGIERTVVVVEGVPDQVPFQYFSTYSRLLTTLIPRSVWPEKPALTEAAVYSGLFDIGSDQKSGIYPAGSVGDFYLQMGVLGIVIGLFVCGIWQRFLYEYMVLNPHNAGNAVLYLLALTSGVFSLRNAGIFDFTSRALPLIVFTVFIGRPLSRGRPLARRRMSLASSST